MYTTTSGLPEDRNITGQNDAPDAVNRASEIHLFNARPVTNEQSGRAIAPVMASPPISWESPESAKLSRRVSKAFREASMNKESKDANEFAQALAEAHVDLTSRIKVIGAVAKCTDKVCNMG